MVLLHVLSREELLLINSCDLTSRLSSWEEGSGGTRGDTLKLGSVCETACACEARGIMRELILEWSCNYKFRTQSERVHLELNTAVDLPNTSYS